MTSVEELRFVTDADVYKNKVLAGNLRRTQAGEIAFEYLPEYNGPDIVHSLPRKQETLSTPGGGLPPFSQGYYQKGIDSLYFNAQRKPPSTTSSHCYSPSAETYQETFKSPLRVKRSSPQLH